MIFTIEWLKDFLSTIKTSNEITTKLNSIGLEVEEDLPDEKVFEKIVVAEIVECENHPDSDHLHICKVYDGKETYQIVCGAPNARKGIKVALALVGAYIPNGDFRIKKSKIRGIDSCGMMCSEREMGISNEHDGIMELPDNCKLGELWVKEYNALEKMPIELSITPNRGDATSVYGIARDLSAGGFGELKTINKANVNETINNTHSVKVNIDNCKYYCREIKGVNANVATPKYILKRNAINGCGDNGIIVNILNYIMFTYGQPMHSYDADKIGKKIIVDYAKNDTFKTLKGEYIKFDKSKILMVSDENKDLCVAGIIGGDDCKTTGETKNILLESAYFPTTPITIGGQELKIVSDARFRYERGINPELTLEMLNLATSMIIELCGGEASDVAFDGKLSEKKIIKYPLSMTNRLLGFDVEKNRVIEILTKLQFEVKDNGDDLEIVVPYFRHDVEFPADIAEEIARIEGYDKIISHPYNLSNNFTKNLFEENIKARKFLASCGLKECVSMAFCDKNKAELFSAINSDLQLANPISQELNYMRPSLLVSLLDAVKNNESAILDNQLAFFEEGMIFTAPNKEGQHNSIAGVFCGYAIENNFLKEGRQFDIFDAKRVLFEMLENVFNINIKNIKIDKCSEKYTHPTRSFNLSIRDKDGEKVIALFGEISPIVLQKFNIKNRVSFFEVFMDKLPKQNKKNTIFTSNNIQPIVRDIAFMVDENIVASQLINAYKDNIIDDVKIVDIFKMPINNQKSVAMRYIFRPQESLSTEQINELMNKIIKAVETKTGAKVRDGR